jgi:ankyrin repeat protein
MSLGANVNAATDDGRTPLMMASGFGGVAVVTELLKAGASPEARLPEGLTAMDFAMAKGQVEVVAVLERVGAGFKVD